MFKKPRRKFSRKTTAGDSDEDKSDDESLKLVLMIRDRCHGNIMTTKVVWGLLRNVGRPLLQWRQSRNSHGIVILPLP